jgi:hypothetical protein
LERVKILYQTGRFPTSQGVLSCLRTIQASEGPRGLLRGNSASVARIMPYSAVHFGAFEYYRRGIMKFEEMHGWQLPSVADGVAGSAAGLTAVVLTYPLDVMRARLAVHVDVHDVPATAATPSSSSSSVVPGASSKPVSSVGRGAAAAAASGARQYSSSSIRGVISNTLRLHSTAAAASTSSAAAVGSAGAGGGATSAIAQIHGVRTLRQMLGYTYRSEGLAGLYRGIIPTLVGIVPYSGLKFFTYQGLKRIYGRYIVTHE